MRRGVASEHADGPAAEQLQSTVDSLERRLAAAIREADHWRGVAEEREPDLSGMRERHSSTAAGELPDTDDPTPDMRLDLARERQRNAEFVDEIAALREGLAARSKELESYRADLGEWLEVHARWLDAKRALEANNADLARQLAQAGSENGQSVRAAAPTQDDGAAIQSLKRNAIAQEAQVRALASRNQRLLRMVEEQSDRLMTDRLTSQIGSVFRSARRRRKFAKDVAAIETFLSGLDPAQLGVAPEGRRARIITYLLGATEYLDDFIAFDREYYRSNYRDIADSKFEPLVHFIQHGGLERRNPCLLFDTEYYIAHTPECIALNEIPIVHYIKWGADKGKSTHPLFDSRFYVDRYADLKVTRCNPLFHYLRYPGCVPHPLVDNEYYLDQSPDLSSTAGNPLLHYLTAGAGEGYNPNRLFDTKFYLSAYPDVARSEINPLIHYVLVGEAEGRATSRRGSAQRRAKPIGADPIVLMVDATYPRPDQDSGSLDHLNFIRIFQRLGYLVYFAADVEMSVQSNYRESLEDMGVICVTYPEYASIDEFIREFADCIDVCFLSRVHFGGRYLETVRALAPDAKIIFNTVDLHFLRERREAELRGDEAGLANASRTETLEVKLIHSADATIVVSQTEATLLQQLAPKANVVAIPLIRDYPAVRTVEFDRRAGIGFIGGYAHQPNVDAAIWFLDNVWRQVRAALPGVTFHVIGANLPKKLSDRADPDVEYVGFVADLPVWLDRLRLTVAPLRYGAGAKGKVVTSLGYGVPCVGTPIAIEGMGLVDGREVVVAETAEQFAVEVVKLYKDENRWTRMSDAGLAHVRNIHSFEHGQTLVAKMLAAIGARKAPSAPLARAAADG